MELRAHLYALVRANQELTPQLTEDEAVTAALDQFGPVLDVTAELVRVNREQKEAPLRQLGLALFTCLIGGGLSYVAFASLNVVQNSAREIEGLLGWPSRLVLVGAPLCLGTIVGRAFPRALHAWFPLIVAAVTWFLTSLLSGIPRALQHLFFDAAGFWRLAEDRIFSLTGIFALGHGVPLVVSFLVLAWTAQSIARRSKSGRGFRTWCREVLRHLPDSWAGGMALAAISGSLLHIIIGPILFLMNSRQADVPSVRSPEFSSLILVNLISMVLQSIAGGWIVGHVLPKRGWTGGMYAAIWGCLYAFLSYNLNLRLGKAVIMPSNYLLLTLFMSWVPTFAYMLTAYVVGQHRLKAK